MIQQEKAMEALHTPVLLEETVSYLAPRKDGELMVDATLGEGGHSFAFLSRFPSLSVIGVDADPAIQERAKKRLVSFGSRMNYYSGWSADFFDAYPAGEKRPDTVLFDLGISMYHYEASGRGFSFLKDEYLDMRIDTSRGRTAAQLIAALSEKELADVLWNNAGERYSRRIARAAKKQGGLTTSGRLAELVRAAVPAKYRHGPLHPATRTFQALRIAVNGELERLPALLEKALAILETGGRMGVITFHSLEDRTVKLFFRENSRDCSCPPSAPVCTCGGKRVRVLTRKAVSAQEEELRRNPPSRSAKLRVAEKLKRAAS
jgi:16S rRNA (cytosine1402-N4)-methyltransferase